MIDHMIGQTEKVLYHFPNNFIDFSCQHTDRACAMFIFRTVPIDINMLLSVPRRINRSVEIIVSQFVSPVI